MPSLLAARVGDRRPEGEPVAQDENGCGPAEERRRQELDRLHAILDAIPTPIIFKDTEGIYRGCNGALLGLGRDQFVGKTVHDVAPLETRGGRVVSPGRVA